MEGWLQQAPLSPVPAMLAGGQAFAEHLPNPVEERTAFVEGAVVTQDLTEQLGVADDHRFHRAHPDSHEIAECWKGREKSLGVAQQRDGVTKHRQRSGRGGD
jgi:hypothetical protein